MLAHSYFDIPNILHPISLIPELSWKYTGICNNFECPDAVAFSSLLNERMVIQWEFNGGLDRSPLDDYSHWIQMYQRPALYKKYQTF